MSNHQGRVYIVTGGASGIGAAAVRRLVGDGGSVVCVDRQLDGMPIDLDRVVPVVGDVCSEATNGASVAAAREHFGGLHGVFLNAGVFAHGLIDRTPLSVLDKAMDVNVRAVVLGIQAALPLMRETGGGGSIVVTSSTAGLTGEPGGWPYNASKGAVINLVKGVAIDLGHEDIRVNAICPGPTKTGMNAPMRADPRIETIMRERVPMLRFADPAELAAVAAFLLGPDSSFITGVAIPVDGGVTAGNGMFPAYSGEGRRESGATEPAGAVSG